MPIRRYFLIIGPALLAFLWWVGWYFEPSRPVRAQTTATAQSAKPSTPAPGTPVAQASSAPAAAAAFAQAVPAPAASGQAAAAQVARAAAPVADVHDGASTGTISSGEARKPSPSSETTRRSGHVSAFKKRKQIAQRRQRRHAYGPTYAHRRPFAAPSHYTYYQQQPFFGFR